MERAGLIRLTETRKNRGTVEKWYQAISRTFGSAQDGGRKRGENAASKRALAMTVLEQSRREVVNAMGRTGEEPPMLARLVMSAPPAMLPKVRQRLYGYLKEIQAEFECDESAPTEADHERWAMTLTFAPVWPKSDRP